GLTAALHTRMSMPPHCLIVPSTNASTSLRRDTLHGMTIASPPFSFMPAATASHRSCLRLDTTTLAPRPARHSTMARPMPLLDPVTTATLPERSNGLIMMLVGSEEDQRFHAPGVGRQAVEALRPDRQAPHDLAHGRVFEVGERVGIVALGQEHVAQ